MGQKKSLDTVFGGDSQHRTGETAYLGPSSCESKDKMGRFRTFEQFLTTSSAQISVVSFAVNLLLAAVLAFILSRVYVRFGRSLSNRKAFARNFVLITMTTMLIITIVKSSLALSLGLVGALSIVRFRTALKEPEELAYMFLCISIGLGLPQGPQSVPSGRGWPPRCSSA